MIIADKEVIYGKDEGGGVGVRGGGKAWEWRFQCSRIICLCRRVVSESVCLYGFELPLHPCLCATCLDHRSFFMIDLSTPSERIQSNCDKHGRRR